MAKADRLFPAGYELNGRYKMGRALGEGGMGLVQKASDLNLDVPVAIKFLKPGGRGGVKALFHREARHAAKFVGNPHIVQLRDVGTAKHGKHGELAYIVYEFCEKGDLSKLVGSGKLELCVRAALDASIGLQYLHENGCTHRDIKPSNLFWGRDSLVKVGDLGLSKLITRRTSTFTGKRLGTPAFMAPEQLRTGKRDDMRVDIYQMGATLYYMLTGDIPGVSGTQRPPPLHEGNEDITETLSTLIAEMIEFSPQARPEDMSEVCARLREELPRGELCPLNPSFHQDMPPLKSIRQALLDKVERVVDSIAQAPALPRVKEKKPWYATVLLRPSEKHEGEARLADRFHPIYFPYYEGATRNGRSDWVQKPDLIDLPFEISKCCSGIPIRWYSEAPAWENKRWIENDYVHVQCDGDFIRYVVLRKVLEARFGDAEEATLIRESYATDRPRKEGERGIGWLILDDGGKECPMSQEIETELLIPIYDPSCQGIDVTAQDILGIVNFEWDEPFGLDREDEICTFLARQVHDECKFPISRFTCDVLQHVTPDGSMAKALDEDDSCCERLEGCRILPRKTVSPSVKGRTPVKKKKKNKKKKKTDTKKAVTKTATRESPAKKSKKTPKKTRKSDPRSKKRKKAVNKPVKRKSRSAKSETTRSKAAKSHPKATKSPRRSSAQSTKKITSKRRRPGR